MATPSAKPTPARVTSSPGRAPAGSSEAAWSGRSTTKDTERDRPAPVSTTRGVAPPRYRGGTFTCSVPPDTEAAGTDRSPNHTTLSAASLSNRFPVTVTVCPGSAAAGSTESTWGAVKKSRFVSHEPPARSTRAPATRPTTRRSGRLGTLTRRRAGPRPLPRPARAEAAAGALARGQLFGGRRRRGRRLGHRPLRDADLDRRRSRLAARGHELDDVPVQERHRLDGLAVQPRALPAAVVDHRDALVVPGHLDVRELDVGVVEAHLGEAPGADDDRHPLRQLHLVAVDGAPRGR